MSNINKTFKLENWYNGCDAAFSSSWDDMTITSIYDITNEANKRNIKTTIYINGINKEWNTDLFYGNDYKNSSDLIFNEKIKNRLKTIHDNGNEIGNHTYSHISLKNKKLDDNIILEIEQCNKLIKSITNQNEFTFCYPHGYLPKHAEISNHINNKFISSRGADYAKNTSQQLNYINTNENINLKLLKTIHVGTHPYKKSTLELNFILDNTIQKKGWLIEYGHGWENDAWCPVDKDMLLKHYDYVSNKNIWCNTILNISKYIKQRESINFKLNKINETEYNLSINNVINNSPITFSFESDSTLEIIQDDKLIKIKKYNNKNYFNLYNYKKCVIKILQ